MEATSQFSRSKVDIKGFDGDIYVDARCDHCASYYKLLLIVSEEEAMDVGTEIGKQLHENGHVSFEECGACNGEY